MSRDSKLVYSTDPALNEKCPKCKEVRSECTCEKPKSATGARYVPNLRMEKSGRGGKTVTVIADLPKETIFLRELTTKLKKKCGSGGTFSTEGRDGVIEIQGDKREIVRAYFAAEGIRVKG